MELFDHIIEKTLNLLSDHTPISFGVNESNGWELTDRNELILGKEMAYELGSTGNKATSFQCLTSSKDLISKDEILLYGSDLNKIKKNASYAKIVLLNVEDLEGDSERIYHQIKDLEFIKYDVMMKGFMVRTSSYDKLEQVRVSKTAIKNGISFEKIGNEYLKAYKQDPKVNFAKIIFITEDMPIFEELSENASKVDKIAQTLNKVLYDMTFDCNTCSLKDICDEVEGLKELHFKNAKK